MNLALTIKDVNLVGVFPRPLKPSDTFYRAINPIFLKKKNGKISKISPGAFSKSNKDKRMSMDWAEKSIVAETYGRWERWGDCRAVVSLTAKLCWDNYQEIYFDPKCDNPSHSGMGDGEHSEKISNTQLRKNLARDAQLLIDADEIP